MRERFGDMRPFVRLFVAPVVVALACAVPAAAQVVFDAASNMAVATASTANPINATWNHTTGLAKKAALVVSVSLDLNGGGATVGSVTYGTEAGGPAQAVIFLGAATNGTNERAQLWGLSNPAPGTHTIQGRVPNPGAHTLLVLAGLNASHYLLQALA